MGAVRALGAGETGASARSRSSRRRVNYRGRGRRRFGAAWDDLIERLVAADHAEIAASSFLQSAHPGFEVADFGAELVVTLGELVVFGMLPGDVSLETIDFTHAVVRQPYPVLEEYDGEEQGRGEPLHGPKSVSERVPRKKWPGRVKPCWPPCVRCAR